MTFAVEDFKVGDTIQAFHPRMLGVVLYGEVVKVGRLWLYVDFGALRGGKFKVGVQDVIANEGQVNA